MRARTLLLTAPSLTPRAGPAARRGAAGPEGAMIIEELMSSSFELLPASTSHAASA